MSVCESQYVSHELTYREIDHAIVFVNSQISSAEEILRMAAFDPDVIINASISYHVTNVKWQNSAAPANWQNSASVNWHQSANWQNWTDYFHLDYKTGEQ